MFYFTTFFSLKHHHLKFSFILYHIFLMIGIFFITEKQHNAQNNIKLGNKN